MSSELLPCPFCGGDAQAAARIAGCEMCHADAPIVAWNRRAAVAVPDGYALISVEALRAWGKLDEVKAACVYPITDSPKPPR